MRLYPAIYCDQALGYNSGRVGTACAAPPCIPDAQPSHINQTSTTPPHQDYSLRSFRTSRGETIATAYPTTNSISRAAMTDTPKDFENLLHDCERSLHKLSRVWNKRIEVGAAFNV